MPELDKYPFLGKTAKTALRFGVAEARRFNHSYIGTEHILLGLVSMSTDKPYESQNPACQALIAVGIDHINKIRSAVEFIIGKGDRMIPDLGPLPFTPRARTVIQLASEEERRVRPEFERAGMVESEHLLLGLVREGEGIAAGVLEALGVKLEKIRAQVLEPARILAEQKRAAEEEEQKARSRAGYELAKIVAETMESNTLTWAQRLEFGARVEDLIAEYAPKDQPQE